MVMYDKVFKGGFVRGNVKSNASDKCWVWGSRVYWPAMYALT